MYFSTYRIQNNYLWTWIKVRTYAHSLPITEYAVNKISFKFPATNETMNHLKKMLWIFIFWKNSVCVILWVEYRNGPKFFFK